MKRCIQDLGFVGVHVHGSTQSINQDNPGLDLFWQTLEKLEVPLYLHPGIPTNHPASMGDELEGTTWEWSFDTATQVVHLNMRNIFDPIQGKGDSIGATRVVFAMNYPNENINFASR